MDCLVLNKSFRLLFPDHFLHCFTKASSFKNSILTISSQVLDNRIKLFRSRNLPDSPEFKKLICDFLLKPEFYRGNSFRKSLPTVQHTNYIQVDKHFFFKSDLYRSERPDGGQRFELQIRCKVVKGST